MWGNNLAKVGLDVYMIPSSSSSSSRRIYYSYELPKKPIAPFIKKKICISKLVARDGPFQYQFLQFFFFKYF